MAAVAFDGFFEKCKTVNLSQILDVVCGIHLLMGLFCWVLVGILLSNSLDVVCRSSAVDITNN
jgi:hypothetical protein